MNHLNLSEDHRIAFERQAAGEGFSKYKDADVSRLEKDEILSYRNIARRVMRKMHETAEKEKREFSATEQKAWDFAQALADDISDEIARRSIVPTELRAAGKFVSNASSGKSNGRVMRDREGREHRVYAPGEHIARNANPDSYGEEIGLGGIVRALACGPRSEAEQRALSEGTNTAGGFTVPVATSKTFIDKMRAASTCIQAGAQTIVLETEQATFARLTGDPGIAWKAENAQFTPSDAVFDSVVFTGKTLFSIVPMSIELLQDTLNADSAIERAIAQKFAEELDRVSMIGAGTSTEPKGIKNQSGISSYSMGTNGLAPTNYDALLQAILQLQNANANPPTAAIMAPRTFQELGTLKDSQGRYLDKPATIRDLPFLVSSQLPINETQGASSTASSIYVGDFADLWIGMRMGLSIKLLTERYADYGQVAIMAMMRCDVQLAHPASFCRIAGVL